MAQTLQPFASSFLKVARAETHIRALEAEMKAFLEKRPFWVELVPSGAATADRYPVDSLCWTVRVAERPPAEWASQVGDIVHNLRSALDLMACDLARLNGGRHDEVYFPFAVRESNLDEQIKRKKFSRAAPDVVDLLKTMKPFTGGNLALRGLHDLDIRDKHQALIPAVGLVKLPELSMQNLANGDVLDLPQWKALFVEDKTVVFVTPPNSMGETSSLLSECCFRLVFPPSTAFRGYEIIPTLQHLRETVSGTVKAFQVLCDSRPSVVREFIGEDPQIGAVFILRQTGEDAPYDLGDLAAKLARLGR